MHWGQDPVLEMHYVPTRSQRARSVLTFFAQDTGTHNLVYANADISKTTQNREAIAFCDHWKNASGADPHMPSFCVANIQQAWNHTVIGVRVRKNRAGCHRRARAAVRAHESAVAQPPAAYMRAHWTDEPARPPQPRQVVHAVRIRAEPGQELARRLRVVHARKWIGHHGINRTPDKWRPLTAVEH